VNTNERVMAWIMDTYSMHKRHTVTAVVTGKPVEMGGSLGGARRPGGLHAGDPEALKRLRMPIEGPRVAVQGSATSGRSRAAHGGAGLKVVAVSDKSGGVYNPTASGSGSPPALPAEAVRRDYKDAEHITNDQLLTIDCDVLVPAAMENVITSKNAATSRRGSSARAPTARPPPNADKILEENGVS
jgi:glutamate dehydrogenase (NAD(P)+)